MSVSDTLPPASVEISVRALSTTEVKPVTTGGYYTWALGRFDRGLKEHKDTLDSNVRLVTTRGTWPPCV